MSMPFDVDPPGSASSGDQNMSPLEQFIFREVEGRQVELNTWTSPKGHTRLLLGAARASNLRTEKLGSDKTPQFTLSHSGRRIGGVYDRMTTLVSDLAVRATSSREMTRRYLTAAEVPCLSARSFHITQGKSAQNFFEKIGQAVNVRPSYTNVKGAVLTNLTTAQQVADAWDRAVDAWAGIPIPRQLMDMEVYLPWVPLRVFVVAEDVVAAVARVPLYVLGDGKQTAGALAAQELQRRNSCQFLASPRNIDAAGLLRLLKVDPDAVLAEGSIQILGHERDGQTGMGWSVDVTEQLSQDLSDLAVEATWAFPGLGATALDILTPSVSSARDAVVASVDPVADLREFRYPAYGRPRYPNIAIMRRIAALETR